MYNTREWIKPCPSHVVCAAVKNLWNQPFCKGLPPEMPFSNDEPHPAAEAGGVPHEEWNVGLDQANARLNGGLPNMPLEEEERRKLEAEKGEIDHDNLAGGGEQGALSVKPDLTANR